MIGYIIATKFGETYEVRYHSDIIGREIDLKTPPQEIVDKIQEISLTLEQNLVPEEKMVLLSQEVEVVKAAKDRAIQEKEAVIVEKEQVIAEKEEVQIQKAQVEAAKAQVEQEKIQVEQEKAVILETANIYKSYLLAMDLTVDQMLALIDIFPSWQTGFTYSVDEKVKYNGKLYRVVQPHTSQDNWTPELATSLFVEIVPPEVIPVWTQPTGTHDAYNIGDKVTYEEIIYTSLIDGNIWSPVDNPAGWQAEGAETPVEPEDPTEPEAPTIADFIQPTGAHDAYNLGDKVNFEGQVYESLIDGNTYSPTAHPQGWQLIE